MSVTRHYPIRIAGFLLSILIACGLILIPSATPVSARDDVPTPVPTLAVTEGGTPSDLPRTQAAAKPRFNAFQRFDLDFVKMTGTNDGWGFAGRSVLTAGSDPGWG
jgi:hypothetical protein